MNVYVQLCVFYAVLYVCIILYTRNHINYAEINKSITIEMFFFFVVFAWLLFQINTFIRNTYLLSVCVCAMSIEVHFLCTYVCDLLSSSFLCTTSSISIFIFVCVYSYGSLRLQSDCFLVCDKWKYCVCR